MSFDHLVRIGRRWVNPWFVIEIEEPPPPCVDCLVVTVVPGRSWRVDGDDARRLRALLPDFPGDATMPSSPPGTGSDRPPPPDVGPPPADEGAPLVESGHSSRPLVRADLVRQARESVE